MHLYYSIDNREYNKIGDDNKTYKQLQRDLCLWLQIKLFFLPFHAKATELIQMFLLRDEINVGILNEIPFRIDENL